MQGTGREKLTSAGRTGCAGLLCAALAFAEACLAVAGLSATATPAGAQFFDFFQRPPGSIPGGYQSRPRARQPGGFPLFGGNSNYEDQWYRPSQPRRVEPRRAEPPQGDFSKAPPPPRRETEPSTHVVVLGDSMADWLASGLEDAFADTPEIGVTRKPRTGSGLIRGEGRDSYDWVQGAKDSLANEKADFVVMMLGLGDRRAMRERQVPRTNQAAGQKPAEPGKPAEAAKPAEPAKPAEAAKPDEPAEADAGATDPASAAPEPGRPATFVSHEFRSDKWVELYSKRIDDTIAAMKGKRVPVIWVGLPPVRGPRSRTELSFLDDLYKARAEKAGIVYVDVWDGFMDESGDFSTYGPDVIGQVRRLRSADGVHFTKAGARKLAHYVEREIRRLLERATPVALPLPEDPQPQKSGAAPQPSGPAPRPAAGPVVPLTGHAPAAEGLLGTGPQGASGGDTVAARVLVRGEPVPAQEGRADNFAWPRPDAAYADAIEPPPEPVAFSRPPQPARAAAPRPGQRQTPQAAATPARPAR